MLWYNLAGIIATKLQPEAKGQNVKLKADSRGGWGFGEAASFWSIQSAENV